MKPEFITSKGAAFPTIVGALLLMIPALLNGFPFIFPDSGDYLVFKPLLHRSPYYGLTISFFHLNTFIWGPVVFQALLGSHIIWLFCRALGVCGNVRFLALVGVLTIASSLPFFVGFIMPDFFTGVLFLSFYLIAFQFDKFSKWLKIYLVFVACVSVLVHVSHVSLALALIMLFALMMALTRRWHRSLGWTLLPLLSGVAATLLFNVVIFETRGLSPAGPSFLLANLIHHGPARTYLEEACPQAGYKICAYKDQLPATADELLWTTGIFQKLGGFEGMKDEAPAIVSATLRSRPGEVLSMVLSNFRAGIGRRAPGAEFKPVYQVPSFNALLIIKFGPSTEQAYRESAEMQRKIPHALLKSIDDISLPLAFLVLLALAGTSWFRKDSEALILCVTVILFVAGNTLLCTSLSGVHDRYQARVTWLLPAAAMALLLRRQRRQEPSP